MSLLKHIYLFQFATKKEYFEYIILNNACNNTLHSLFEAQLASKGVLRRLDGVTEFWLGSFHFFLFTMSQSIIPYFLSIKSFKLRWFMILGKEQHFVSKRLVAIFNMLKHYTLWREIFTYWIIIYLISTLSQKKTSFHFKIFNTFYFTKKKNTILIVLYFLQLICTLQFLFTSEFIWNLQFLFFAQRTLILI